MSQQGRMIYDNGGVGINPELYPLKSLFTRVQVIWKGTDHIVIPMPYSMNQVTDDGNKLVTRNGIEKRFHRPELIHGCNWNGTALVHRTLFLSIQTPFLSNCKMLYAQVCGS